MNRIHMIIFLYCLAFGIVAHSYISSFIENTKIEPVARSNKNFVPTMYYIAGRSGILIQNAGVLKDVVITGNTFVSVSSARAMRIENNMVVTIESDK